MMNANAPELKVADLLERAQYALRSYGDWQTARFLIVRALALIDESAQPS